MKKIKIYSAAVAALISVSACSTYDAYTGEKKASKTLIGSAIGGSVAAVVAYIDNKDKDSTTRRQRILAATAGGAAIGGGIGFYMDRQEAKLRQQLRSTGVSIQREGDNVNLIMPGNITFNSGSAALKPSFYKVLNSVAIVVNEYNRTIVAVSGHTDSTGSDQVNRQLSQQRANAVSSYLRSQKVMAERLDAIGFGSANPIASNETATGREQNRRVEITLLPIAE